MNKSEKLPPQDIELEKAVLGAIIIEPEAFLKVSDILNPLDFYKAEHAIIFESIIQMFTKNVKIDMLSLVDDLRKRNKIDEVGGAFYVVELTKNVASSAHIEQHAFIVSELSMRRKLIKEASDILTMAYDSSIDFDTTIERTINIVDRVTVTASEKSKVVSYIEAVQMFMDDLSEKQKFEPKNKGISTHISTLKKLVPEYRPGDFILIPARPSMGKTDLMLNEAFNAVMDGHAVIIFSLETKAKNLVSRLIQKKSGITKYDMERKLTAVEYEQIDKAISRTQEIGLFIDDTARASTAHIYAKAKAYKKMHDIKAVFIDYVQLIHPDTSLPREQQVSTISRQLKIMAMELNLPVIALSQLNRNAEARKAEGYKPMISDLRESGALEQDADLIMMPYRPEYYYPDDYELKGKGLIIVGKHRDGATGEAKINVDLAKHTWTGAYDCNYAPPDLTIINTTEPKEPDYETPF